MSSGDWASTREAVERLNATGKVGTAENELLECARRHDAQTRASYVLRDGLAVEIPPRMSGRVWDAIAEAGRQDWQAGVFDYTTPAPSRLFGGGETLNWRAIGVEFYWPDITALLGLSIAPDLPEAEAPALKERDALRGILPASATKNDRKHEGAAHDAAAIVRTERVSRSKAFERSAERFSGDMRDQKSIERAIRHSFDKMYRPDGLPHQN